MKFSMRFSHILASTALLGALPSLPLPSDLQNFTSIAQAFPVANELSTQTLRIAQSLSDENAEAPASWQVFTSEAGRFAVSMPSDPIEVMQSVPTEVGTSTLHMFGQMRLEAQSMVFYMVGYSDFPGDPSAITSSDIDAALDSGCRAFGGSNATIVNQQVIRLQDYPGREVEGRSAELPYFRVRCFMAEQRLYFVAIIANELPFPFGAGKLPGTLGFEALRPSTADLFLDSFQLVQRTP